MLHSESYLGYENYVYRYSVCNKFVCYNHLKLFAWGWLKGGGEELISTHNSRSTIAIYSTNSFHGVIFVL